MAAIPYEDPGILYEDPLVPYESSVPEQPQAIETWVTTPDGTYIAHLDRSEESPFRAFAISLIRNEPGAGSLEYHPDNEILTDHPTLFDLGNLVWMKYRTMIRAWIIEGERATLDQNWHASDWRKVSGRGTLQLLADRVVYPTGFANGTNLDPSTWASQWYSVINRAAGEMLWDMISDSNSRFVSQVVRGVVQTTGSDGWTQDFRFENLLEDVAKPVTDVHGDVAMDGLTFSYYTAQGSDKTASVVFEEGADLLTLTQDRSDRDRVSYVIGEGVGEGVFAKLAIASRADARRIEGFLAAKDAANVPLLQNLTDAALAENDRRETVSFEIDETRYKVYTHFDLGDTVRAIAPSRSVDTNQRIDAIYLAEDGDRVRVALDLNGLRDDELLKLYGKIERTRSQLGVRNRQPQGQLVPFSFSGADIFDSTDTMDVFLLVPSRMYVLIEARAMIRFREFFAPATAAASGGGSTSGSGGSSSPTSANTDLIITLANCPFHGGHSHFTAIDPHSHTVTIAAHDHSTPAHAHGLTYGVFKETYPASHSVTLKVYELVVSTWTLRATITGITADLSDQDLSAYITGPGSWRLELKSEAAQPNGGRLGCDVAGYVLGAIKSA